VVNLARVFGSAELDAFVTFSSGSAVWGSGMLAGYAAANAYLDAFVPQLRRRGIPATSVAWGAWAGDGMGAAEVGRELRRRGIVGMPPTLALHELRAALERDETAMVVADIRWPDFVPTFAARRESPLLARLVGEFDSGDDDAAGGSSALAAQVLSLPDNDRVKLLRQTVRQHAAAVLGYADPSEVRPDATFQDIGFDSIAVVGIGRRLTEATGVRVPATAVFDHPTPDALARFLLDRILAAAPTIHSGHPIDDLEQWLAGMAGDGDGLSDALARLAAIADRLRGGGAEPDTVTDLTDLTDASEDELFRFVDDELGL
jgi:acyl carrier protein